MFGKRRAIAGVVTAVFLMSASGAVALAQGPSDPPPRLNWGKETNAAQCNTGEDPVISITREVVNSLDSGFGDDRWWAYDDYRQEIQVWQTGEDTFCVVSRYQGQFDAGEGLDSPGQDGEEDDTLEGDESGPFEGGFRAIITGTLLEDPEWSTHGFVGTQDYQCDLQAILGGGAVCPGQVDWKDKYFTGASQNLEWWGWIYHGGNDGTWVNASSGSEGDID